MKYIIAIALLLTGSWISAQNSSSAKLPDVFMIGEYEESYLSLSQSFPGHFLSLYQDNIDHAYTAWSSLLMDMEDEAGRLDFDLKGIKLWLNIYFNADGTIGHIAYYPKPNSRNVPDEHLAAFFKTFLRNYSFPRQHAEGFQHSASASFPTFFNKEMVKK